MVQIRLKRKYTTALRSRYGAVGDHQWRSKKGMAQGSTTVKYNPREHVLVLRTTGKKVFLHGDAARKVLGE